ncbi:hypothetical protein [Streptomyces qaidamensis]|uniref:hypothetical protein n=1 Tax=Streptomyces qaidamensis TaxID=1783515 RepID=UPI000AF8D1D6|nr:hypothetical protein [Streptomyces qaidamensis]
MLDETGSSPVRGDGSTNTSAGTGPGSPDVGTGECVVLRHAHHPWIAFAQLRREWYTDEFLTPPPWAHTFTDFGFAVLDRALLSAPLADIDTSVLARGEWRQVRLHDITGLGGVLFNAWD